MSNYPWVSSAWLESFTGKDMTCMNHLMRYQIFSWTWLKCLYGLFCRFQCVPLQCNLYLVHPSLSNISSVSSIFSSPPHLQKCSSTSLLAHLTHHPQAFFATFLQAPFFGMTLQTSIQARHQTRWFIIDVLTLGPDWALEIVAWSSPGDLAECLGPGWQMVGF